MVRSVQSPRHESVQLPIDVAIVEAVASATGTDEMALPPLGHVVDADALEALLDGAQDEDLTISFEYAGHHVEVGGDRSVSLADAGQ